MQGAPGGFVVASANPPYKYGDSVQLTAYAEPGFQFEGWMVSNIDSNASTTDLA